MMKIWRCAKEIARTPARLPLVYVAYSRQYKVILAVLRVAGKTASHSWVSVSVEEILYSEYTVSFSFSFGFSERKHECSCGCWSIIDTRADQSINHPTALSYRPALCLSTPPPSLSQHSVTAWCRSIMCTCRILLSQCSPLHPLPVLLLLLLIIAVTLHVVHSHSALPAQSAPPSSLVMSLFAIYFNDYFSSTTTSSSF